MSCSASLCGDGCCTATTTAAIGPASSIPRSRGLRPTSKPPTEYSLSSISPLAGQLNAPDPTDARRLSSLSGVAGLFEESFDSDERRPDVGAAFGIPADQVGGFGQYELVRAAFADGLVRDR